MVIYKGNIPMGGQGIEYWDTHIQQNTNNLPDWVKLYERIAKILPTDKNVAIADFGCQGGYFAEFLHKKGYKNYWGIDFAPSTIKMARISVPEFKFTVGNVYDKKIQDEFPKYDVFIGIQFFHFIKRDLDVINKFPSGKSVILSVANRSSLETVRMFRKVKEVRARYSSVINIIDVEKVIRPRKRIFYLIYGTKI